MANGRRRTWRIRNAVGGWCVSTSEKGQKFRGLARWDRLELTTADVRFVTATTDVTGVLLLL